MPGGTGVEAPGWRAVAGGTGPGTLRPGPASGDEAAAAAVAMDEEVRAATGGGAGTRATPQAWQAVARGAL